jgi:hypothetical protein
MVVERSRHLRPPTIRNRTFRRWDSQQLIGLDTRRVGFRNVRHWGRAHTHSRPGTAFVLFFWASTSRLAAEAVRRPNGITTAHGREHLAGWMDLLLRSFDLNMEFSLASIIDVTMRTGRWTVFDPTILYLSQPTRL